MKENVNCCLHKFTSLVESEHFQYQPTVNIHVSRAVVEFTLDEKTWDFNTFQ